MSGFHVEWFNVSKKYKAVQHTRIRSVAAPPRNSLETTVSESQPLNASLLEQPGVSEKAENNKVHEQLPLIAFRSSSPCDTIIMRNGETVLGNVIEASTEFVKYNECGGELDSLVMTISMEEVTAIKYYDGHSELTEAKDTIVKQVHPLAVASFLLGCFSLPLPPLGFAAIAVGNAALKKIKLEPEIYNGEYIANIGIGLGKGILVYTLFWLTIFAIWILVILIIESQ